MRAGFRDLGLPGALSPGALSQPGPDVKSRWSRSPGGRASRGLAGPHLRLTWLNPADLIPGQASTFHSSGLVAAGRWSRTNWFLGPAHSRAGAARGGGRDSMLEGGGLRGPAPSHRSVRTHGHAASWLVVVLILLLDNSQVWQTRNTASQVSKFHFYPIYQAVPGLCTRLVLCSCYAINHSVQTVSPFFVAQKLPKL